MLPKKNRADKKAVEKVFQEGRLLKSSDLNFKYFKAETEDGSKISVIAPKSIFKSAVKRNLLRRLGYTLLKKYINLAPSPITGVLILGKKSVENLENEIKNIFSKIY